MEKDLYKEITEFMHTSYVGNKKFCWNCKNMNMDGYCTKGASPIKYFGVKSKHDCKFKNFENESKLKSKRGTNE